MLKYTVTSIALKTFSSNFLTRRMYRYLGNTYGVRKRVHDDIPEYYIDRIKRMLDLCRNGQIIIRNGDNILEVGTGWLHWEAMTIKLFYDVEATLFDVWDNRQFDALKHYFLMLGKSVDHKLELSTVERQRAHEIINLILSASTIDTLYQKLGFKYIVDNTGTLKQFADQSYAVIISAGVLEHVKKEILTDCINDYYRVLKPGGYSIHSINIGDHLSHYDPTASKKEYLQFSDIMWKYLFQNDVQYFNRVQCSEWLKIFSQAGLELIDEQSHCEEMPGLKVHKQFKHLEKADINCISLKIVHQKPLESK